MQLRSATAMPLNATESSRDRLQTAARELEAQFAQMMLKSMRSTSFGDSLLGDNNTMYRDMYDQKLSRELSKGQGLGLAPMIVRQLERSMAPEAATPAASTFDGGGGIPLTRNLPLAMPLSSGPAASMSLPDASLSPGNTLSLAPSSSGVSLRAVAPVALPMPSATAPVDACDTSAPLDCSSPEAFVQSIWPHAKRTAAELGVSPKVLVAQAALETGWGRRLVGGDGSHNLFGIKATGWNGNRVNAGTHEFVNGRRQDQRADFRAYGSIHESFDDYARLMRNDRYAGALAAGEDARGFARALQHAGYATDPSYAAKISAIVDGPTLQRALGALDNEPTPRAYAALPATTPRG